MEVSGIPIQGERDLDKIIMEALNIDGRMTWQAIARATGVHERTVARRGNALLDSGAVRVVAISMPAPGVVLSLKCGPGQSRVASRALSLHDDVLWVHVTTGDFDVVAEICLTEGHDEQFLLEDLPAVAGVREVRAYPVVEYLRLGRWWRFGFLNAQERAMLGGRTSVGRSYSMRSHDGLSSPDRILVDALRKDGRMPYEELARLAGVSDVTARRRVDALRQEGLIAIRAVIDPVELGLEVEALMWLEVPPRHVPSVAAGLRRADQIKYASRLAGPWTFLIKTQISSRTAVDEILPAEPWTEQITRWNIATAIRTDKSSGVRSSDLKPDT